MTPAGAAAREVRRDRGLVRGIGGVAFAAAIVNAVVGAGIFSLPGRMAAAAGPHAWAAYLVCAVWIGAVVLCLAEAGSRVPTSGGTYGYIDAAFGARAGFVAGVLLYLSCALACAGIADAFWSASAALLPVLSSAGARAGTIAAIVIGLAALNLAGAARASRLILIGTVLKTLPLALVIVAGIAAMDPGKLAAGVAAPHGFGRAVLLSLFAFQGAETAIAASGEVATPARTIPRALIGAMAFVVLLYTALQLVAQGLLGAALAGTANPLADAAATVDPRLGGVLLAGAALSMGAWIASDLLGAPRILFAFARDGALPAALGRVSARTHVPHVAILTHAAIVLALALTGTFEQLAVLSVLAGVALYMMSAAAAWRLRRRAVATAGAPIKVPGLAAIALLSIAFGLVAILLARPVEIGGLVLTIVAAALFHALRRPRARLDEAQADPY